MNEIRVIGPRDPRPTDGIVLNVTSTGTTWVRDFSPMLLGPVKLYGGYGSFNVENAWQYSKVYKEHLDIDVTDGSRDVSYTYFNWAIHGWGDKRGQRYPMGKGAIPEFSIWDGEKLDYLEARKVIYEPLYRQAVYASGLFEGFVGFVWEALRSGPVYIFDFDGYDHKALNMTYDDVLNNPNRKMGHGFVLAKMLEEELKA